MIKSAEDFLKEHGLSKDEVAWTNSEIEVPIKELMREYAAQFINLAAEEAKVHQHNRDFNTSTKAKIIRQKAMVSEVDKESILKLKELL